MVLWNIITEVAIGSWIKKIVVTVIITNIAVTVAIAAKRVIIAIGITTIVSKHTVAIVAVVTSVQAVHDYYCYCFDWINSI